MLAGLERRVDRDAEQRFAGQLAEERGGVLRMRVGPVAAQARAARVDEHGPVRAHPHERRARPALGERSTVVAVLGRAVERSLDECEARGGFHGLRP
jgi:hypothetical protein